MLKPTDSSLPALARNVCLPFLRSSQLDDGAWGYHPGGTASVEATAWCLLALQGISEDAGRVERALRWLAAAQSPDGSWPTRPQTVEGNWVTALAGLALVALEGPAQAIAKAAAWTCQSEPGEIKLRSRIRRWLAPKGIVEQDFSLKGWSWTSGTASWVEPTAVSLLFLHQLPVALTPPRSSERRRSGEGMLYNRMCAGGGWNLGNPKVYGVVGIPQIGPTAWALLALQEHVARSESQQSLDWLEKQYDSIAGPTSLALAFLALQANGRSPAPLEPRLARMHEIESFLDNTLAHAQAIFALKNGPDALRWRAAAP